MAGRLLTVLYPGFAEWEVVVPAFCLHPRILTSYLSLGEPVVRGAMGFAIEARDTLATLDAGSFDGIFLPGGLDPETQRFPRGLGEEEALLDLLRDFDRREKVIAAICGAPLVLGAAGLLDGRRYACDITENTRGWLDRGVRAPRPLAVDGRILTASVGALLPFAQALARLFGYEETAREIGTFFVPPE